jgi:hypothetical protein
MSQNLSTEVEAYLGEITDTASFAYFGLIKVGPGLSITSDGTLFTISAAINATTLATLATSAVPGIANAITLELHSFDKIIPRIANLVPGIMQPRKGLSITNGTISISPATQTSL